MGLCLLLGACASSTESHIATRPSAAAEECRPLAARIERFERESETLDEAREGEPVAHARAMIALHAAAGEDLSKTTAKDAKVRALADDYATLVKDSGAVITATLPKLERLAAAVRHVREASDAWALSVRDALEACQSHKAKACPTPDRFPSKGESDYADRAGALLREMRGAKVKDASVRRELSASSAKLADEMEAMAELGRAKQDWSYAMDDLRTRDGERVRAVRVATLDRRLHDICGAAKGI